MNKEILRILLDKPELYLRAWVWLYSRVDDKGIVKFTYEDMDLSGKVKVTDPTFKRILHIEQEWNRHRRYTKVESVIPTTSPVTYSVAFFEKPLELSEEEKTALTKIDTGKEIKPRKLSDEQILLRKQCLDLYVFFYETRIGIKPPINALQMKFLDTMIKYFQSTGKANTNESVVLAFHMIYKYWDTYPEQIKAKYLINQISYNLPNILAHIRLAHKNSKLNKVEELGKNIGTAIESGSLDEQISKLGKR